MLSGPKRCFTPVFHLVNIFFKKKTVLLATFIRDLYQSCWSRKCSLDIMSGSKLTPTQILKSSFKRRRYFFFLTIRCFQRLRFRKKTFNSHIFWGLYQKRFFHFPLLLSSKYIFYPRDFRDLLKELILIIFRPPTPK